jgi:hypothetical protein
VLDWRPFLRQVSALPAAMSRLPAPALVLAIFVLALVSACSGASQPTDTGSPPGDAASEFRRASAEQAAAALDRIRAIYQTRAQEIADAAVGGRFRLVDAGRTVPADVSYLAARMAVLLDASRPIDSRLNDGVEAATVLVAGFRTTQMSEFGIAAHDVIDYLRGLAEDAAPGALAAGFQASELAPLEQQLKALETSCTCR